MFGYGRHVFGLAAIALGLVGLVFGDFAAVWQPVAKELPRYTDLAYGAAAIEILAGLALQWRRTAAPGAFLLAALFSVFAFYWGQRAAGFPELLGIWSGFAEQLALVVAALAVFALALPASSAASGHARLLRATFGVCLLIFGAAHFLYMKETATMVPEWIPPGQPEWVIVTGVLQVMAGLALITNVAALVAAQLLTAMFIGFGMLVWLPQVFAHPESHVAWAGNAINLALIGAAWVMTDCAAARS